MFIHGKKGTTYYSVREKIRYYKDILSGKINAPEKVERAKKRLPELQKINNQSYSEPTMIVTDDKHFGNGISKPRGAVVVGEDYKKRLIVCPVVDRTVKSIVLDNDTSRQVDQSYRKLDRSDVYETKCIKGLAILTAGDKKRIKDVWTKK